MLKDSSARPRLLYQKARKSSIEFCKTLYGNGRAAEIIMQTIKESL